MSFSVDDCLVISTALQRIPEPVLTSGAEFSYLIVNVVDEVESSREVATRAKKESSKRRGSCMMPRSQLNMHLKMSPVCESKPQIQIEAKWSFSLTL